MAVLMPVLITDPPSYSGGRSSLARRIARSAVSLTVAEWCSKVLNFVFVIAAIRLLGESGFGRYAMAGAFVSVFGIFFELGLRPYVQRAIGSGEANARVILGNLLTLRAALAAVGCVVVPVLGWMARYEGIVVYAIFLQTLTFLIAALLAPAETLLAAHERVDIDSGIRLAIQGVYTGLALLILTRGFNFLVLFYLAFVTMPLQLMLSYTAVRRLGFYPGRLRVEPKSWARLLRASVPFALSSVALVSNFNADTVILSLFATAASVGWYNAPYRLVFSVTSVAAGFYRGITPSLVREQVGNPAHVLKWIRGGILGLLVLGLPAATGVSILSELIVRLLYGSSYAPSASVLMLLAWDIPLVMFTAFAGNSTIVLRLERPTARVHLAAAAFNVGMNLLLIPRWGIMAAAATTVTTDLLISVGLWTLLARSVDLRPLVRPLGGAVLASSFMGLTVWFVKSWGFAPAVCSGLVSYALFAHFFGAVDQSVLIRIQQAGRQWRLGRSS